jgi:hypothetical protein
MPLEAPSSLASLLSLFRPCFSAPSFVSFSALTLGFLAHVGRHTVTGCLQAAGLAGIWHHARAHRFFSTARWSPDALGLILLDLVVAKLVPAGAPLLLAVDDTLLRRSGRKVSGSAWHYDAAAKTKRGQRSAWGNNFVCLGLVVELPFLKRPLCLPLLFRLWRPKDPRRTKPWLARELVELVAERHPGRRIEVVADAAYAAQALACLPESVTLTARLRRDAALFAQAPPRTGKRGRPRKKGERLPTLSELADDPRTEWQTLALSRYGVSAEVRVHAVRCLWYGVFAGQEVTVVLVREQKTTAGFDLALVSSNTEASALALVERYARRWAIEVCFQEAKQLAGVGEAQNRVERAVERTAPFGFLCLSLAIVWYALYGHAPADVAAHRARAPWYRTKAHPSVADMLVKLRRVVIAEQFQPGRGRDPIPQEIQTAAWVLGVAAA